ncbi:pilus assembly protein TadG-related protein [Spirillospora sp. NPDC047279]|uniref:pilus assembly protein TadG-related protein n=1 Tax=Spirillospora sp. NPDC047279 TaxID=3155478 RepID=UPI0033E7D2A4
MNDDTRHQDSGQVTAFAIVMVSALILVTGLVLDGGLILSARVRAIGEAQEAARAGAQAIDLQVYRTRGDVVLNLPQASAAARAYLSATGASGDVQVSPARVMVTVHRTQPTQILNVIGLGAVQVRATASARAARGITTEIP